VTFRQLDAFSDRFAHLLREGGMQPGDRVAVMLPNCPQFHIAFYGILKAGCIHVPINPMFKSAELAYTLADSGARWIVTLDELAPLVQAASPDPGIRILCTRLSDFLPAVLRLPIPASLRNPPSARPAGVADLLETLARMPAHPFPMAGDLDAPAALNYTGGTTGLPKGCIHTQRDMVYTAACAATYLVEDAPDNVGLTYVPIFWIAGENNGLLQPVFSGRPTVLLTRWDADAVLEAIRVYRVTHLLIVMDHLVELMDHPRVREVDLSCVRRALAMSFIKKVSVEYRRRWKELAGAYSQLREAAYGMTETHTADTITTGFQEDDYDLRSEPVFVGLPMPGTEIRIVDFDTRRPLPIGESGEIAIRTPSLFKGYWNKPEETARALADGWLYTGDIGRFDEKGCLHYLGRRKEMLKVSGVSVFPAEIEVLLSRHPAVHRCAVVGRPDPVKGEVPVAFVELDPAGQTEWDAASLAAWCRAEMSPHKVPEIIIVDQLPLTATGKVQKDVLRKRWDTG
jgi:long-chain acyl-CoA synthetase